MHQPVYLDILPKYVLLLLISPPLLIALQRGFGAFVLVASALGWMAVQLSGGYPSLVADLCASCRQGPEEMAAWQLVWVTGMYCGYRYRDGRPIVPGRLTLAVSVTVATLLFLVRHAIVPVPLDAASISQPALGWVRVLNVLTLGLVLAGVLQHVPRQRGFAWLELLGRSSLQVFAFQVALLYVVYPFHEQLQRAVGAPGIALVNLVLVGTLTLPALACARYGAARRARAIGQLQPAA